MLTSMVVRQKAKMSNIVYSKPQCPFCDKAKHLLTSKGYQYIEIVLEKDMLREDFIATFPDQKTVPLIIMNGVKYNGYDRLKEYFDNGGE